MRSGSRSISRSDPTQSVDAATFQARAASHVHVCVHAVYDRDATREASQTHFRLECGPIRDMFEVYAQSPLHRRAIEKKQQGSRPRDCISQTSARTKLATQLDNVHYVNLSP